MSLTGIGEVAGLVTSVIDRVFPDPIEAAKMKIAVLQMDQQGKLADIQAQVDLAKSQAGVNAVEAASSSFFVAGWRPFIGWGCGASFLYVAMIQPLMLFILRAFGNSMVPPVIDATLMTQVLVGMLGLGAMRSFDKYQGTSPTTHG